MVMSLYQVYNRVKLLGIWVALVGQMMGYTNSSARWSNEGRERKNDCGVIEFQCNAEIMTGTD
jgi:hypothetical protein